MFWSRSMPGTSRRQGCQTAQCPMVFVAVDEVGDPVAVPQWTPVTMLELQRQRQARVRIRTRQAHRGVPSTQRYSSPEHRTQHHTPHLVSRADVNSYGAVNGGQVMRWIDEAANICAAGGRSSRSDVLRRRDPLPQARRFGDHSEWSDADLVHTGPRSIHVGVRVSDRHGHGEAYVAAESSRRRVRSMTGRGPTRQAVDARRCRRPPARDRHARHWSTLRGSFEPYPPRQASRQSSSDQSPSRNAASKNSNSRRIARP